MAIVNRKSGMVSGAIGDEVFCRWHGAQTVRKFPCEYTARNTARWRATKYYLMTFSSIWKALPADIRGLWDNFAASQGNASEVEAEGNCRYPHNPIPSYPPRPKLISGENAFIALNCKAAFCGMDVPRYYPPIGVEVPAHPALEFKGFDKSTGEIVIGVRTPELGERSAEMSDRKICIWLNALKRKYIIQRRCIDVINCPAKPAALELRYKEVGGTQKEYGHKPLVFGEIEWVNLDIAAHTVTAIDSKYAPQVSPMSNVLVFTLLNDPRMVDLHDLIANGQLITLGKIKFDAPFYQMVDKMRRQDFVTVNQSNQRNVVIGAGDQNKPKLYSEWDNAAKSAMWEL